MCTGAGNDRVVEERRSFDEIRINLGPGDDRMTVLNPIDTILAGAGDDTIRLPETAGLPSLPVPATT